MHQQTKGESVKIKADTLGCRLFYYLTFKNERIIKL